MIFVDMSKAFDSVSRKSLVSALDRWKLPRTERNLILEQYNGSEVFVEFGGYMAEPFVHCTGVRQGCCLSAQLFALVLAEIHEKMEEKTAKQTSVMESFSDDIVLDGNNELEVKIALRYLRALLAEVGLKVNDEKTRTIIFDVTSPTSIQVEWLGITLTTNLDWTPEVNRRIRKMAEAAEAIGRISFKSRISLPHT